MLDRMPLGLLARQHLRRDVEGEHRDPVRLAVRTENRLVDEIEEVILRRPVSRHRLHRQLVSGERFARLIDPVEEAEETELLRVWHGLGDGASGRIQPEEPVVERVRELVDVIRAAQHRDRGRRIHQYRADSTALRAAQLLGFRERRRARVRHLPEELLVDGGRGAGTEDAEEPAILFGELVGGQRPHLRDADHLVARHERDRVERLHAARTETRALPDGIPRGIAEGCGFALEGDLAREPLAELQREAGSHVLLDADGGAGDEAVALPEHEDRGVDRGRRLQERREQSREQIVEIPALEGRERDAVERLERAIARLGVALDRGGNRAIDRGVEDLHRERAGVSGMLVAPLAQDARAKSRELVDHLREVEALVESRVRVRVGVAERHIRRATRGQLLRDRRDPLEQVRHMIQQRLL